MSHFEHTLRSWVEGHLLVSRIAKFSPEEESFLIILEASKTSYNIAGQYHSINDSREDCQRHARARPAKEVFLLSSVPQHSLLRFCEGEFVGLCENDH